MPAPQRMIPRRVNSLSNEYLEAFRVLVLNGPRQSGKTTLLRQLVEARGGELRSLDDEATLRAALDDPTGFVRADVQPLCIDEVQRGGDALVRAVKSVVDSDDVAGQFALAGSTRFLTDPSLHESLAGRSGVLEVLPFSQSELIGSGGDFLDVAFAGGSPEISRLAPLDITRETYLDLLTQGGFPEVQRLPTGRIRDAWFSAYVRGVTDRDIREMARVNQPSAAGAVLRALAAISGQQLVTTTVAEKADLSRATVERYIELLDAVFLVHRLRPWSRNPLAQAVRRPKAHLVDTGLLCHLLGATATSLARPTSPHVGAVAETFVFNELRKQASWAETQLRLFHYRDSRGHSEVDVIAESAAGDVVAIEVKAGLTVTEADFRHLRTLRTKMGATFVHGFVFYFGRRTLRFGDGLTALPVGALWAALTTAG